MDKLPPLSRSRMRPRSCRNAGVEFWPDDGCRRGPEKGGVSVFCPKAPWWANFRSFVNIYIYICI